MHITEFEPYIPDKILERGYVYYNQGHVENIVHIDEDQVQAKVSGTDEYVVNIFQSQKRDLRASCTCPFDNDQFCKHQVAVLYALKGGEKEDQSSLKQLLQTLDQETLIEIILQQTHEHPELEKTISMKYGENSNEVEEASQLIHSYFEQATNRGFIDWRNIRYAMRGSELVLEQASTFLEDNKPQKSISLALLVLAESVDVLGYCDDSGGEVGMVIDESMEIINDAINHVSVQQSHEIQEKIFHKLKHESSHPRYKDWDEWGIALLDICRRLSNPTHLKEELIQTLETWIDELSKNSSRHSYTIERLLLIKLDLIEQHEQNQYLDFLKEHRNYSAFRERLIEYYFKGSYDEVIRLCEEGEEKDKRLPGLVKRWKAHRYKAYEYNGDVENQKELGEELLIQRDFDYYLKLKKLYTTEEWEIALPRILEKLETSHYPQTYVKILIEENLTSKLLRYCEETPRSVLRLYPHLIDQYPKEVEQLFNRHILGMASGASNRKEYREVCRVIQSFETACGKQAAYQVITELEKEYPNRPAFLDELSKIK